MGIRPGPYHSSRPSHPLSLIANDTIHPKRETQGGPRHTVKPHPLSLCGEWGSIWGALYRAPTTFGNPATSLLERSIGFAPPPRGGFAFVASPERHSTCELSY